MLSVEQFSEDPPKKQEKRRVSLRCSFKTLLKPPSDGYPKTLQTHTSSRGLPFPRLPYGERIHEGVKVHTALQSTAELAVAIGREGGNEPEGDSLKKKNHQLDGLEGPFSTSIFPAAR